MHIQLLYTQQASVYYKLTNALVLTQCLHTQLYCDSENETRLHFQMTPTILLFGHNPWNSSWLKSGLACSNPLSTRQLMSPGLCPSKETVVWTFIGASDYDAANQQNVIAFYSPRNTKHITMTFTSLHTHSASCRLPQTLSPFNWGPLTHC